MYRGKYMNSLCGGDFMRVRASIPEFAPGEKDAYDAMAIYAVIYDEDDVPFGCGRMYINDDSHFCLDLIGVVPEKRRMFIGDLIVRMLLYRAQVLNAASIEIRVPDDLMHYFARYGFRCAEEAGLVLGRSGHVMRVTSDGIRLEGSCSHGKACNGDCAHCG